MTEPRESTFEGAHVLRMFPSFVWKAEIRPQIRAPLNDGIMRKVAEIRPATVMLKPGESWQSHHQLHFAGEFRGLADAVQAAAGAVLDHLRIGSQELLITGCWANVSAPGARHGTHSHPNNFLSGTYYVQVHDGADTLNFHDPRPQCGLIRPPVEELTADNADQIVVKVEEGTLLLFPAWLQHSVSPNRSQDLRVSISFNLMFASYAETMAAPLWEGGHRRSA